MSESFWMPDMPGSEVEIVCIDLDTRTEQPVQVQLFQEDELVV
jgi:hypothetical protein